MAFLLSLSVYFYRPNMSMLYFLNENNHLIFEIIQTMAHFEPFDVWVNPNYLFVNIA